MEDTKNEVKKFQNTVKYDLQPGTSPEGTQPGFLEVSMEPPGRVEQALTFQELALSLPSGDSRSWRGPGMPQPHSLPAPRSQAFPNPDPWPTFMSPFQNHACMGVAAHYIL